MYGSDVFSNLWRFTRQRLDVKKNRSETAFDQFNAVSSAVFSYTISLTDQMFDSTNTVKKPVRACLLSMHPKPTLRWFMHAKAYLCFLCLCAWINVIAKRYLNKDLCTWHDMWLSYYATVGKKANVDSWLFITVTHTLQNTLCFCGICDRSSQRNLKLGVALWGCEKLPLGKITWLDSVSQKDSLLITVSFQSCWSLAWLTGSHRRMIF